ncbi:MAG TPA: hypothetical protein PLI96_07900 [Halothiobacillus sp.]|nr:hypothetical protein [Halothiobacillus sp.]
MARAPAEPKPTPDMIRDSGISALGNAAVSDGAIVALIIYETAGNKVAIRSHNNSHCTVIGLLREAAKMEGIIDE